MSADQIEIDIERTREDLRQNVDALQEKLSPTHAAKRTAARLGESVSQARDTLMGTAEDSVSKLKGTAEDSVAKTQESIAGVSDKISSGARGNPIAVGLGAFALGGLESSLIPATKTEQHAAETILESDLTASMVTPMADTARTLAENAGDTAKEAAQEVGREAQSAAATVTESIGSHIPDASSVGPQ